MINKPLTQTRLLELFNYNPDTGDFIRRITTGGQKAGTPVSSTNITPSIKVDRETYTISNLIWLYMNGSLPYAKLSFLDGDKANWKFSNIEIKAHPEKITQEYLKTLFSYNPATGEFIRIQPVSKQKYKGQIAGFIGGEGYRIIKIHQKAYKAHRLAFLYMTGKFPDNCVDHLNHDRSDNRWVNLKSVTKSENATNLKMSSSNKYGCFGISMRKNGSYRAVIRNNGKPVHLGTFKDLNDAIKVRKNAEIKYGYSPFHGS